MLKKDGPGGISVLGSVIEKLRESTKATGFWTTVAFIVIVALTVAAIVVWSI